MNLFQIYIKNKFSSTREFAKGMNMSFPTALRYLRNPRELSIAHAIHLSELTGDALKDVVEYITYDNESILKNLHTRYGNKVVSE